MGFDRRVGGDVGKRSARGWLTLYAKGFLRVAVFHAVGTAFDHHGGRPVQQPVEDRRSDASVVVKDARPMLIGLVGRDDERAAFVALTDDLEEQVGPGFIQRQITRYVQNQHRRGEVFLKLHVEPVRGLRGDQGVERINSRGEEYGVPGLAGRVTERGGQVAFPQADASAKNHVGVLFRKPQLEEVPDLRLVDLVRTVPAKLIEAFAHGETRRAESPLQRAGLPFVGFGFDHAAQKLGVAPPFLRGLRTQLGVVAQRVSDFQIL